MPVETTTGVPSSFTAGDTVRFSLGYSDYPAPDWTLGFTIRSAANGPLTVPATADGTDHAIALTHAQTLALLPGWYVWAAIATETATGDVATAEQGTLQVKANPATGATGPRRLAYIAARTALESLAAKQYSSVSVEGESYSLANIGELTKLVSYLESLALAEDAELGLPVGGGLKRIRMTF